VGGINPPSHRDYPKYIKEFSRSLRKNPTEAEKKFWQVLRGNSTGFKFRRQFAIDSKYIADFVCLEKRLIIEIDGGQHNENEKDIERTLYLESENFRVIRFWNNEVLQNLEGCYQILLNELEKPSLTPHPNPPPQGGRESVRTPITEISVDVLDKNAKPIGAKSFYNIPNNEFLSDWIVRVKANNIDALPLKNAISPTTNTKDVRGTKWADGAIASMICKGSDLQNAGTQTALLSSGYCSAGGFFVTEQNLWQAAVIFAVRRLIKPTWINDRDQFLQPTKLLSQEFKTDCLIWMLFNGSNLTASANNLEWNGKKWSIVNHFIPFTEAEVNAPDRFESDFMVRYLAGEMPCGEQSPPPLRGRVREGGNNSAPNPLLSSSTPALPRKGREKKEV
jgi:very-short-patch-repair endonuclease